MAKQHWGGKRKGYGSLMFDDHHGHRPARAKRKKKDQDQAENPDLRGFYCEFCRTRQPGGTPDIWKCPFGCDASQPKCKVCFQPQLNRPPRPADVLLAWHVKHARTCRAPEPQRASRAPARVFENGDFSPKRLTAFAAAIALEVKPSAILRRIAEGARLPVEELVDQAVKAAVKGGLREDAQAADHVVASALWTSLVLAVKEQDWPHRVASWAWATKEFALQCGLNSVTIAELEVRAQLRSWTKQRRVHDRAVDAATAAWMVGERAFAKRVIRWNSR